MSIKWFDIPGYDGHYQISKSGKVRLAPRKIQNDAGEILTTIKSKELDYRDEGDSKSVVLHNGQKYVKESISHLLDITFNN